MTSRVDVKQMATGSKKQQQRMKLLVQNLTFMFATSFPHFVCSRGVLTPVSNSHSRPVMLTLGNNI